MEAIMLKNLRLKNLFALTLILVVSFSFSNKLFAEAVWVPFPGGSDAPTPAKVTVLESDDNHTIIDYDIPGMWVDKVEVQGKVFQRISLPDWSGTTLEIGKPEVPVLRDFVAMPWGNQANVKVIGNKNIKLKGYNVYPFQTPKTDDDTITGPFDYDEYFYSQDQFYPYELSLVSKPLIMRDLNLANVSADIFRFNPVEQTLEVNYEIQVELINNYIGSDEFQPIGPLNPDYAVIYRVLVLNYDYLNLTEGYNGSYDYLIITPDQFNNSVPLNSLVSHLVSEGHLVRVASLSETGSTWQEIKLAIKKAYEGWQISYVLLLGDVNLLPIPYDHDIPSDFVYSCIEGDDINAEATIGRLSVDSLRDLGHQVSKITNYHSSQGPSGWTDRILFVTGGRKAPYFYELCKNTIKNFLSPEPPYITYLRGSNSNYDNSDVINAINQGQVIVNYRGHGDEVSWYDWYWGDPSSWTDSDIRQLRNDGFLCTVFSTGCKNGKIDFNECLCEYWMSEEFGAVASIGPTGSAYTIQNNDLDIWLFKYIYGVGIHKVDEVGLALYGARNEMLKIWYPSQDYYEAVTVALMYLLLGDPSMEIRVGNNKSDMGALSKQHNSETTKSSDLSSVYVYSLSKVFPNPVSDIATVFFSIPRQTVVKISLYDLSGRYLKTLFSAELSQGEHSFTLDSGELSNGVYILRMDTEDFSASKNILIVK